MYGEYEHILSKVIGAKVARYALSPETGFIPVAKELADVASGSQLIALVNPNSPTGVCVGHAFFETLLSSISPETWVWVDETYIDMAPGQPSIETWVPRYPRLIVSKSMSKFYALSGVRVGYLAASAELVSRMESTIPPWDIGLIAQVAAVEALRDDAYYSAKTEETARYRDAFFSELQSIPGLSPVRSDTNFILIRLDKPVAAALCSSTAEVDVFLRDCDSLSEWFGGHYVRTAVKTPDENAKIVAAIRRFFQ
jgi:histidinol-phosphate/aromatic aminotransferase/cobyric acid decarboxylase-like protein